jgi:succinate-acetate transporter protein
MSPVIIINIFTSIAVFIGGLVMLLGLIPHIPMQTRVIFGIIFMSYGVFRFLNVQTKLKIKKQNEMKEKMMKETDELIHKK